MRFLCRVNTSVICETGRIRKRFLTNVTGAQFLTTVNTHMILDNPLGKKFWASVAHVRSLKCVNMLVTGEGRRARKCLLADTIYVPFF
ncbi:hypothetical protein CEXT_732131 [Caerostris extrusa]|uniref:Ribosomal protein L14 n=1 Tax=Caerostris extrusa TaxID=172846 RepID=A0AAV4T7C1_CAEEX|nr:hypothetical protein CEXT_732131 [Caerostris extrusa]